MRKKYIRFRGEASHYLFLPKTTKIVLKAPGSDANVAELQLEGVSPEDRDGKTIMIDVERAPGLSESKTRVLKRGDLTEEEWKTINEKGFTVPYRDSYD
jgi:hypothetical protein